MPSQNHSNVSRRTFVRQTGLLAGGMLMGSHAGPAVGASPGELSKRTLGRTEVPVTVFTLGTAPCGFAKPKSLKNIADTVNTALDLGVNFVDTAPRYDAAEEGVGLGLGQRRKEVFLSTKVWADTIDEAEQSLSNSLKMLKTDHVDLLYFHSLGHRKVDKARDPDGVFTWLLKQKQAGKTRFLGVSGHNTPGRFPRFLESGEVDVLLTVVNFVDRHTYHFEEQVLPVAVKHKVGIVAMKVFGGAKGPGNAYENPQAPPNLDLKYLELAMRYSLGIPGVTTLEIGCHNPDQVRRNVEMIHRYRPLSADEQTDLLRVGRELAAGWGPHFGPVT